MARNTDYLPIPWIKILYRFVSGSGGSGRAISGRYLMTSFPNPFLLEPLVDVMYAVFNITR